MLKQKSQRITVCGMLIAVGIILPFATAHGLGLKGNILLPMHIPVFLIGFLCGPVYGGICGAVIPVLNSILTGMPAFYPNLPCMIGELMVYGALGGILYGHTPLRNFKLGIYPAMLIAMICGRLMYGAIFYLLMIADTDIGTYSIAASVIIGLPGIVVQLLLVPAVVIAVRFNLFKRNSDAVTSAINLIREETATIVIIKDNTIIKTVSGRGIQPVIDIYESGVFEGAFVADKIIGKAAAMIFTLGGIKGCYGDVLSVSAKEWLENHGICVQYGALTETIENRTGTGMCPMEEAVKDIHTPEEALTALKKKLEVLRKI